MIGLADALQDMYLCLKRDEAMVEPLTFFHMFGNTPSSIGTDRMKDMMFSTSSTLILIHCERI